MLLFRGDSENLEGRVVVYARQVSGGVAAALYSTVSLVDFRKRAELTDGQYEHIVAESERCAGRGSIPVYQARVVVDGERSFYYGSADVLFAGERADLGSCHRLVNECTDRYMLRFFELANEGVSFVEMDDVSHECVNPEGFSDFISTAYIVPMFLAAKNKESCDLMKLQREFRRFMKGFNVGRDIDELCSAVERVSDFEILSVYAHKLQAIKQEKYESARDFANVISGLLKV